MQHHWIDFRQVKEAADFEAILDHYNIKLRGGGEQRTALCPFHAEENPSFNANLGKKAFHCFGCDAKGNVLEFVAQMEDMSLRDAAKKIGEICGFVATIKPPPRNVKNSGATVAKEDASGRGAQRPSRAAVRARAQPPPEPEEAAREAPSEAEEPINPRLSFELRLEPGHPYLAERGVSPDVAEHFGLGYCSRGLQKGRIAIPIYDHEGDLVAYAGRWAASEVPKGTQKYLLPPKFKKLAVLYNLHRVAGEEFVVAVEGYFSVFRLHEFGIPAVSLMGHVLSDEHLDLLISSEVRRIMLMLDGDDAGRQPTKEMLPRLAKHFFVRDAILPLGEQPDTISELLVRQLVGIP